MKDSQQKGTPCLKLSSFVVVHRTEDLPVDTSLLHHEGASSYSIHQENASLLKDESPSHLALLQEDEEKSLSYRYIERDTECYVEDHQHLHKQAPSSREHHTRKRELLRISDSIPVLFLHQYNQHAVIRDISSQNDNSILTSAIRIQYKDRWNKGIQR